MVVVVSHDYKASTRGAETAALIPAELVQALVVDAEVVGNLVDDGHRHLLDDVLAGSRRCPGWVGGRW